jgi:hypothetical protein
MGSVKSVSSADATTEFDIAFGPNPRQMLAVIGR